MSVAIFVYYKAAGDAAAVRTRIDAIQAEVFAITGVQGRLLRRRDDQDTWMEVYEPVPDSDRFEQVLDAALARHGFPELLAPDGMRHTERFVAA